jgi:transposase
MGGKLSRFPYQIQKEDYGMRVFVGLDVALAKTSICVAATRYRL